MSLPSGEPDLAPAALDEPQRIDPRSVTVGRIAGWIFVLVLAGFTLPGLLGALLFAGTFIDMLGLVVALLGVLAVLAFFGLLAHVRPQWRYEYTRYRIDPYGIEIASGRFFRRVITVPHARVQHIDVLQGPLERRYDLANLVIYTAGTSNSAVRLPLLAHPVAIEVRERLVKERGLDAV